MDPSQYHNLGNLLSGHLPNKFMEEVEKICINLFLVSHEVRPAYGFDLHRAYTDELHADLNSYFEKESLPVKAYQKDFTLPVMINTNILSESDLEKRDGEDAGLRYGRIFGYPEIFSIEQLNRFTISPAPEPNYLIGLIINSKKILGYRQTCAIGFSISDAITILNKLAILGIKEFKVQISVGGLGARHIGRLKFTDELLEPEQAGCKKVETVKTNQILPT